MSNSPLFDNMNNDVTFYKFGIFYFNRKDSRFMVPKATKLGYTMNFAKPQAYIVIAFIILLVSLAIFLI
jgi:uncharacterized membrane protein